MSACSRVGSSPDVELAMIASGRCRAARAGEQLPLERLPLGRALLHEVGARTASSTVSANVTAPSAGSGASVSRP